MDCVRKKRTNMSHLINGDELRSTAHWLNIICFFFVTRFILLVFEFLESSYFLFELTNRWVPGCILLLKCNIHHKKIYLVIDHLHLSHPTHFVNLLTVEYKLYMKILHWVNRLRFDVRRKRECKHIIHFWNFFFSHLF